MTDKSLDLDPALDLQVRTSKMLGLGIAFSVWPFFGIASVFVGLKCAKTVYFSGIRIRGRFAVWWCIIVGIIQIGLTGRVILSWFR